KTSAYATTPAATARSGLTAGGRGERRAERAATRTTRPTSTSSGRRPVNALAFHRARNSTRLAAKRATPAASIRSSARMPALRVTARAPESGVSGGGAHNVRRVVEHHLPPIGFALEDVGREHRRDCHAASHLGEDVLGAG